MVVCKNPMDFGRTSRILGILGFFIGKCVKYQRENRCFLRARNFFRARKFFYPGTKRTLYMQRLPRPSAGTFGRLLGDAAGTCAGTHHTVTFFPHCPAILAPNFPTIFPSFSPHFPSFSLIIFPHWKWIPHPEFPSFSLFHPKNSASEIHHVVGNPTICFIST